MIALLVAFGVSASTTTPPLSGLMRSLSRPFPPLLHAYYMGTETVYAGRNSANAIEDLEACSKYVMELRKDKDRTEEESRNIPRYERYYDSARDSMLRSLAIVQHQLERAPAPGADPPPEVIRVKGEPLKVRFPRRSDFGKPLADPFTGNASSDGVKAGNLEFER